MTDLRVAALRTIGLILIAAAFYFLTAVAGLNPFQHFDNQVAVGTAGGCALFIGLLLIAVPAD